MIALDDLSACPLFSHLEAERLAQLAQGATLRHYRRDTTIFLKGTRPSHLLWLRQGLLKETCLAPTGDEHVLEILTPGALCGETGVIEEHPLPYSVISVQESEVILFERQRLLDLIADDPHLATLLASLLAQRVVRLIEDIERLTLKSPLARIAGYLGTLRAQAGKDVIRLPATKRLIAARLGVSAEAFSRTLRDLTEAGIITVAGQQIHLLHPERLCEFAEDNLGSIG